ncbi:hypothetical protein [Pseudomonas syringae]|uniref:hypothetical protein n=1 Tax=Pseudomonas syringae TaxID=317 RepID=UPI0004635BA1|nr:hypothetical protein [Pseudomonas syringae]
MNKFVQWRGKGYPFTTDDILDDLLANFVNSQEAQEVSFRELVPWMKIGERATHYIHSYPAKLLPHIAHFFLASERLCPQAGCVLDPFSGTGTVALEAMLSGRKAFYADANPLARLITSAKTTIVSETELKEAFKQCISDFKKNRTHSHPEIVNIEHWYTPETINHLSRLKAAISHQPSGTIKDFLLITFSSITRKSSLADPRLSVPVKIKDYPGRKDRKSTSVINYFSDQFDSNLKRMRELSDMDSGTFRPSSAGRDARKLVIEPGEPLPSNSIDLVITSPPYAGAQKYIRATSLNLGWLDFAKPSELRGLEDQNIGREHIPKQKYMHFTNTGIKNADEILERVYHINPLRASIASTYLIEMRQALVEAFRVLKPGGQLVLVIGNNIVCGHEFMSSDYLLEICESLGMELKLKLIDSIKSRGLMTKRNKTASLITREWVLVLRKSI